MIASWAGKYVGLPYEEGSWGPRTFDCWGLIAHVYRSEFDVDVLLDMREYSEITQVDRLEEYLPLWNKVEIPRPGDGILFLIANSLPHCGIFVGDGRMLHSIKGVSSCIQKLDTLKWKSRLEGYYRYSDRNS